MRSWAASPHSPARPIRRCFGRASASRSPGVKSNAIVFANSVIGARTNRYGDFIDLCCAMTGRGAGLGPASRWRAGVAGSCSISRDFRARSLPATPVRRRRPGGRQAEWRRVPVIEGMPATRDEDQLKALGRGRGDDRRGRPVPCGRHHAGSERSHEAAFAGGTPRQRRSASRPPISTRHWPGYRPCPTERAMAAVSLGTPHFS